MKWKTTKNHKGMLGKHHSEETKKKIGKIHKGKKMSDIARKKMSKAKIGVERPEKVCEKIRQTLTGKKRPEVSGKNHYNYGKFGEDASNWQGGGVTLLSRQIRFCFKYRQWRSDIFTRDNFICQECGNNKMKNPEAHHIKSLKEIIKKYNIKILKEALDCEELWNINNGITYCRNCHKKTDNYGGVKHNNG